MAEYKIFNVLKKPHYLVLAIFSSLAFLLIYVYTQLLGIVQNLGVWLATIPVQNALLLLTFTAIFGITFSYQVFLFLQPKFCDRNQQVKGVGAGGIGTLGMFFVAQCPACASLGVFFLPLSVLSVFSKYGWVFNLIGIFLLLFTIHYLGGFKKNY